MSYESAGGSLKLKGVLDKQISKKKKKSKHHSKELIVPVINKADVNDSNGSNTDKSKIEIIGSTNVKQDDKSEQSKKPAKTKAELEFERAMEKRIEEKILKRAEKSHKEHVEEYNRHLDSLSEYNDIPKVSWTK